MTARIVRATVGVEVLEPAALLAEAGDERCGALCTFFGVVRNHDHGEHVDRLEYSAHPDAGRVLAQIAAEFANRDGVHALSVAHRIGPLGVGDVALAAIVAAEHRGEGFAAVQELVEEVKRRLPIWKRQEFAGGGAEWVGLTP